MQTSSVNVPTHASSHATFASSLATQSRHAYARLVHCSLVVEHLPLGAFSASEVENISASQIYSLADLQRVLRRLVQCMDCNNTNNTIWDGCTMGDDSPSVRSQSWGRSASRQRGVSSPFLGSWRHMSTSYADDTLWAATAPPSAAASAEGLHANMKRAFHIDASKSCTTPSASNVARDATAMRAPVSPSTSLSHGGPSASYSESSAPQPFQSNQPDAEGAEKNPFYPPPLSSADVNAGTTTGTTPPSSDLEGWLFLLVWVRHEVIYLLRELSAAQATVAWSAWYWAWAQEHPRQATVHYALGTWRFWRDAVIGRRGVAAQVAEVQCAASGHMLALRGLFKLIVSCVGTVHSVMERLNTTLKEMEREFDIPDPTRLTTSANFVSATAAPSSPVDDGDVLVRSMLLQHGYGGTESPGGGDGFSAADRNSTSQAAGPNDVIEMLRLAIVSAITSLTALVDPGDLSAHENHEELWLDGGSILQGGVKGLREALKRGVPTSPQLRLGEYQRARLASLPEGTKALLHCVERSRFFLHALQGVIHRAHRPPATRHWRRVTAFTLTTVPVVLWLNTKSPRQLAALSKRAWHMASQMVTSYVVVPCQQLREAVFYVRPGVEERRTAFDRDATALANIVRDYHEDYYQDISQERLNQVRDTCLDCLRRGVADDAGFGLIESSYRKSVKHPIRSTLFGDLPRILLIQMSLQALEVSRVTNGLDEVLEGNDLNFKVMAIMPVVAAAAFGTLWGLLKLRSKMMPVKRRMKLFWRAIYRVVTLAEGDGTSTTPPYKVRGFSFEGVGSGVDRGGGGGGVASSSGGFTQVPSPSSHTGVSLHPQPPPAHNSSSTTVPPYEKRDSKECCRESPSPAWARTSNGTYPPSIHLPSHGGRREHGSVDGDDTSSSSSHGPLYGLRSVRILSNYEQGLVLLLVHLMRTTAEEYFRSYPLYHELMEDLHDLESTRCTRHQRLETLRRMSQIHAFLR